MPVGRVVLGDSVDSANGRLLAVLRYDSSGFGQHASQRPYSENNAVKMAVRKLPPVAVVDSRALPKTSLRSKLPIMPAFAKLSSPKTEARSKLPSSASAMLPMLPNGSKTMATSLWLGAVRATAKAVLWVPTAEAKSPLLEKFWAPPPATASLKAL
jgi:hypothetical protein